MRKAGMNMSSPAAARLSRYSEREEHCAIKLSSSPFIVLMSLCSFLEQRECYTPERTRQNVFIE